ncbi:MAG TPA: MFS transporter [Desulfobacteraceae bacterium]|nr:MFS transporter [Desulfobacteraceae bacterium]HPJ68548.1 MFS transporter [Desulfobacteraceae bacterium]HPQ28694.1 MFS transporter [Desulfobacteraceae bacterium]
MNKNRKAVWGWAIYDWANSAFATTVMAGFFPVFFKQYWSCGVDVNISTARLGLGNSLASLLVALMAPVLGAIADRGSARKRFLLFFAYLGVLMTASLFFMHKGEWAWAIFVYCMGIIGFSGANVFYDSLLPGVATENNIDYISALGYGMGYLGGGILFLINILITIMPERFGLNDSAQAVRYSFVSVALWWGLFTILTALWVPEERHSKSLKERKNFIRDGISQFTGTFREISRLKTVFLFLLAYWFYIDGVDTIVRMAVDYGMSLGFNHNDLIIALLMVQFIGFPSALIFGKLGQFWGVRKSIYLAIGVYMCATLWGALMTERYEFYILAITIGLVQGGIQALSRSYYSRFIPEGQAAEYYGFFNMLGKFAAICGPALMGLVGLTARGMLMPDSPSPGQIEHVGRLASRWGIASLIVLFLIGAILFYFVEEEKGRGSKGSAVV